MYKLTKHCNYRATVFNVLPAVVITPLESGFIVAIKWGFRHLGWRFENSQQYKQLTAPDVIEGKQC